MMPGVLSMWCLGRDGNHEIAQMFHLHVGSNWLKDATGPDLFLGWPKGVLKVAI